MLYIQKGLRGQYMTDTGKTFKEFLSEYKPPTVSISEDNKKELKGIAPYGFSGFLADNKRDNEHAKSRDLITLDLDQINPKINNQEDLHQAISKVLGLSCLLYPTITNGLNHHLRYRLVFECPHLLPKTYATVAKGLTYWLIDGGVLTGADTTSFTTAQLFGLPIRNQYSPGDLIKELNGEKLTEENLKPMLPEFEEFNAKHERKPSDPRTTAYIPGRASHRTTKYTGALFNKIVSGIGEGERNNTMNSLLFYLIRQGMTPDNAYNLGEVMNQNYFTPPLETKELNKIYNSAKKGAERQNGRRYYFFKKARRN